MSDDAAPLASFSLTHIYYNPSDPISHLCAWLALLPQALCVVYMTLVIVTREAEVALMFAGQMACEAVNFALKRLIKEHRPARFHGKGYGMPSSHAQFVAFWAVAVSLFMLFRHKPRSHPSTTIRDGASRPAASTNATGKGSVARKWQYRHHEPHPFSARVVASVGAIALAGLVAWSRTYLSYHTAKQVLAGSFAGVTCAVVWFGAVSVLRSYGIFDMALQHPVMRYFRVRDLLTREDICQAGWEKWEEDRLSDENEKRR